MAGFVLANGSLSSKTSGEGEIRRRLVESDLVDCIVSMPDRLFFNTAIPVCLWFVGKSRSNGGYRNRSGEVLFIDARRLGRMTNRTLRVLDDVDIDSVAEAYHAWRGELSPAPYVDRPGFCRSATLEEIQAQGFVLTPGRYVGAADVEDDTEPIDEKLARLRSRVRAEFKESDRLQAMIEERLGGLFGE
jgi:type I restriction enzyme M protein